MSAENWKVQVSYKTPAGDLINIRAESTDELSVLLEGVGDYATQIAATGKAIGLQYNLTPLSTSSSTASTPVSDSFATTQAQPASNTTGAPVPTCLHGERRHMSGVSKKTGSPYSMWVCTQPQGPTQCKPMNA